MKQPEYREALKEIRKEFELRHITKSGYRLDCLYREYKIVLRLIQERRFKSIPVMQEQSFRRTLKRWEWTSKRIKGHTRYFKPDEDESLSIFSSVGRLVNKVMAEGKSRCKRW